MGNKLDLAKNKTGNFRFKFNFIAKGLYSFNSRHKMSKPDPLVVRQALDNFGGNIEIHPTVLEKFENYEKLVENLQSPDIEQGKYDLDSFTLTAQQTHGVEFMINAGNACILADDMGLGKTLECLALVEYMKYKRVLILAPANVKTNWKKEIEKWGIDGNITVCAGNKEKRKKLLKESVRFVCINYEMLDPDKYPDLFSNHWDCILFDEAHYMKNRKSKRSENATKLKADKKIFITGTPFCNNAAEVWTLLNMIDPKRFSSYWEFTNFFCNVRDTHFGIEISGVDEANAKYLKYILSRYMIRRDKDIKALKVFHTHLLSFGEEQDKLYTKLEDDFVYGDEIATTPVEKFIRLLQVSASPKILGLDAPSVIDDKVQDLVKQYDERIIIGTVYKQHVGVLAEKCFATRRQVSQITGDTKNRDEIVQNFKNSENGILVATITSIAEGISVNECNRMILADRTFSPTKNNQFFNRIHRLNSTNDKHYHILVTHGVNTLKDEALAIKEDMIQQLMAGERINKRIQKGSLEDWVMNKMKEGKGL